MVYARLPERPKGADCKSAGIAFRSSNLLPGTANKAHAMIRVGFRMSGLRRLVSKMGLNDKSVSGRGVDQRFVSFLQIGALKPAFFVHYL